MAQDPSQIKPISTENETKNIKFKTARAELSCRTYFLKYGNDQSLYATCCKWHRVAAAVQIKSLFFWKALVSETLVAMSVELFSAQYRAAAAEEYCEAQGKGRAKGRPRKVT